MSSSEQEPLSEHEAVSLSQPQSPAVTGTPARGMALTRHARTARALKPFVPTSWSGNGLMMRLDVGRSGRGSPTLVAGYAPVKFIGDMGRVLNCQVSLTRLHNSNFGLLGGPWLGVHGPSGHYNGPMGVQVSVLSPNDHPNPSQARQKGFRKS